MELENPHVMISAVKSTFVGVVLSKNDVEGSSREEEEEEVVDLVCCLLSWVQQVVEKANPALKPVWIFVEEEQGERYLREMI